MDRFAIQLEPPVALSERKTFTEKYGLVNKSIIKSILKKSEQERQHVLWEYALMVWDGISFFGYDQTSLDGLKGKQPSFKNKFQHCSWVFK